jgi:hypothetical protein
MVLELALEHGWKPAGTVCDQSLYARFGIGYVPDVEVHYGINWDGNYTSNNGEMVTAEDAQALGDALERALPSLSTREVPAFVTMGILGFGTVEDHKTFLAEEVEGLKRFIAFCRKGAFSIT